MSSTDFKRSSARLFAVNGYSQAGSIIHAGGDLNPGVPGDKNIIPACINIQGSLKSK